MTIIDGDLAPGRGRSAANPSEIPLEGWKDILWRVWAEFNEDRLTLIAAGAAFYLLLALFPALAAFVALYGFVADPVTIADHIAFLAGVLPSGGVELISTQLRALASQNEAALSFAFVFGLLFALWSANNGIKTLFEALNVAYEEREKRSFLRLNLVSLLFTLGAIVIGIVFIVSVGVVPAALSLVGLSGAEEMLISLTRWPVLFIASAAAISLLYRYGPSRERARWRWVTWGSAMATLLWLVSSILFSWYLSNFADYNATYGSLGAVIGFMMWTWISVVILLLGAELNAELEHQTARDSTTGPEMPMGARGASMADTLGASRHSAAAQAKHERKAAEPLEFAEQEDGSMEIEERQRPDRLGTILGFALPLAAIGIGIALEIFDRRRAARIRKTSPQRYAAAIPLWERGRALLEDPVMRERLSHAARTAFAYASQTATAQRRTAKRWWRAAGR